jgi:hypothetical protein
VLNFRVSQKQETAEIAEQLSALQEGTHATVFAAHWTVLFVSLLSYNLEVLFSMKEG